MPTIITRGVISARSAGTFAYVPPAPVPPVPPPPPGPTPPPPPGPVYQTVQFTNSGSWTCPAGVFYIVNLEVAGGMYYTTSGQWIYSVAAATAFYSLEGSSQAGSPSGFFTYEQVGSLYADPLLAQMNSGGTGERSITYAPVFNYYNPSTNGFWTDFQPFVTITIRGVATPTYGPWDNRSGQPVRGIGNGWIIGAELYFPPETSNGTPSSAFGYTAAGGTSPDQQFVTTASYVPVTPGQTYSIQVGTSGGSVVLQFVQ